MSRKSLESSSAVVNFYLGIDLQNENTNYPYLEIDNYSHQYDPVNQKQTVDMWLREVTNRNDGDLFIGGEAHPKIIFSIGKNELEGTIYELNLVNITRLSTDPTKYAESKLDPDPLTFDEMGIDFV